ncbi:MAG: hypothetical protein CMN30_01920 [Sandaracinus sp.]|nr:hypothetical protein [Sandaracinus sp.]
MADAVENALREGGVALIEAGTGTGKTLAYLVPALLSGKKVVVATRTKNLQDQLRLKDLPLLRRTLEPEGFEVEVAFMKGLANYLCLRRFEAARRSALAEEPWAKRQLAIVERWRETTTTGERSDLKELEESAGIWAHVQSGSDTRIGQRCPHYEDCFVTTMRREADQAQLIVVNHHLFFADLAMRGPHGGAVLPDYDAVIFDEAHAIEDVATVFFGAEISTGRIERLARDATGALGAIKDGSPLPERLRATADAFFLALPEPGGGGGAESRRDLPRSVFTEALEQRYFALDDALEALESHCRLAGREAESVRQIARRAGELRDDLARVPDAAEGRAVPWIARRGHGVAIGVSPVDVSTLLREELMLKTETVIFTSATLTTGGSFDFIEGRLGIDSDVEQLALASPFEFADQAALYLPSGLPDPREPAFVDVAAESILALNAITDGGAFVLCTSFRSMHALAQACRPTLIDRKHRILVQGEAPKSSLLKRFRESGDAVLFATMSFWEGVDVPGSALRLVVLDKIPFQSPGDPLLKARSQSIEESGGSAFRELHLPTAALTLQQGFGRLIRSQSDRGVVAILDRRIRTKGYGRYLLASLPDASRCYSLDEVRAFWERPES